MVRQRIGVSECWLRAHLRWRGVVVVGADGPACYGPYSPKPSGKGLVTPTPPRRSVSGCSSAGMVTTAALLRLPPSFGNEMDIDGVVGVKADAEVARVARMTDLANMVKKRRVLWWTDGRASE